MVSVVSTVVVLGGGSVVVGTSSAVDVGGSVGSAVESPSVEVGPGGFSSTQEQTEAAALRIAGTWATPQSDRMHGRAVARMALEDSGVQRPAICQPPSGLRSGNSQATSVVSVQPTCDPAETMQLS